VHAKWFHEGQVQKMFCGREPVEGVAHQVAEKTAQRIVRPWPESRRPSYDRRGISARDVHDPSGKHDKFVGHISPNSTLERVNKWP